MLLPVTVMAACSAASAEFAVFNAEN